MSDTQPQPAKYWTLVERAEDGRQTWEHRMRHGVLVMVDRYGWDNPPTSIVFVPSTTAVGPDASSAASGDPSELGRRVVVNVTNVSRAETPEQRMAAAEERHRNIVEITTPHPWRYAPGLSPSMCESCADCGRDPRNTIHRDASGNRL